MHVEGGAQGEPPLLRRVSELVSVAEEIGFPPRIYPRELDCTRGNNAPDMIFMASLQRSGVDTALKSMQRLLPPFPL